MSRKAVKVNGSIWTKVTVDPLEVMEEEYQSNIPSTGWLESINGRYLIMDDDRGVDYELKEITKAEFDYLKSLRETILACKLVRV